MNSFDNFFIRPMQFSDLASMTAIAEQTHLRSWHQSVFKDCFKINYFGWVLTVDAEVCGFAIIRVQLDESELLVIAISPSYQKKGLAKKLLQYVVTELQTKKIKQLHLEVRKSNQTAIRLYQSMGFIQVGMRRNYYPIENGCYEDAILFSLEIN